MAECPFPFNMQLFQEMKYKFPDIPIEIIQNCITKYPRDREACIQLLNKASMNSIGASTMTNFPKNHHYSINVHSKFPATKNGSNSHLGNQILSPPSNYVNFHKPTEAQMKMDKLGTSCFPLFSHDASTGKMAVHPYNVRSAPMVPSEFRPFSPMYSKNVCGEHSGTSQNSALHQAIFSSIRPIGWNCASNAQLPSVTTNKPVAQINSAATNPLPLTNKENETRHITTLKINPLPPYIYNPASSIMRNITPSGRHMTSVNLQLQPPSSEPQAPIEITTTPLTYGTNQEENSSFNSHVQISISSTGATLTAVRTNKKPPVSCSTAEQPLAAQRNASTPCASVVSMQEHDTSNVQHASGHYAASLQNNSQTSRFVNLLNVPKPQETLQHKPFQQIPFCYPAVLDNQPVRTVTSDEFAYTQALLLQQRTRLNFIQAVLKQERDILSRMKTEVNKMERDLLQRRLDLTAVSNMTDMQNLREENRQLRVECHCLSMEVDLYLRGQVPLGETDEDFYRNIFTGPVGPIPPAPSCQGADTSEGLTTENEDKDTWKCLKCTFANHPALNKCEICEMPRPSSSGHTQSGPTYHTQYHRIINAPQTRRVSPERNTRTWPRRGIGHVQIRVTQNRSTVPSKGLDIHLSHRYPRR